MGTRISTMAGTVSGTLLSTVPNIHSEDIARTFILAAVGAVASFCVTLLLKALMKRKDKRQDDAE